MEAYRQLAMTGPIVIIGDFNAAPTMDDGGGRPTPEDTAVKMARQHHDVQDLTASLQTEASHRPQQLGSTDSRIDLCYAGPTHVEVTRTKYHDLPSKANRVPPTRGTAQGAAGPRDPLRQYGPGHTPPHTPPGGTGHTSAWHTTSQWTASSASRAIWT